MSNFEEPKVELNESNYNIAKDENGFRKSSTGSIRVDFLDELDKIISYDSEVAIDSQKITLEKWNFLVDIWDFNKKYEFYGEWFVIKNNWASSFYIDNHSSRSYIFSFDSILEIDLIDPKTENKVNTLYLYPKQFIAFSPKINRIVRNADLLRISQIFSLWYISESIIKNHQVNSLWSEKVLFWDEEKKKILENMFLYKYQTNKKNINLINEFRDAKKFVVNWEAFIEDYFWLFLNDGKKKVYYKNLIIRKLSDMIKNPVASRADINYLTQKLESLKSISQKDYNKLKNIVIYYSSIFIKTNKDVKKEKLFLELISKLQGKNDYFKDDLIIELNNIFYDYNYYREENLYSNLKDFSNKYTSTLTDEDRKWYFVFFLEKIILSAFDKVNSWENIALNDLLSIIKNYTQTSLNFYKAENEKDRDKKRKKIETGIKTYNKIIKNLSEKIRKTYFKDELTNSGILIIKKGKVDGHKMYSLKWDLEKIYNFFEENKAYLSDSWINKLIKKQFVESRNNLNMYFEALDDYESYSIKYEERNKKFDFKNLNNLENDSLSIEKLTNYLQKFNYLNTSNTKINIKDYSYCKTKVEDLNSPDYCYEVKGLQIWFWVAIDFLFFPMEENKISDIVINWDDSVNKWNYILNKIEEEYWNKKFNNKDDNKNKDRYLFENFFLYTFNPPEEFRDKEIYKEEKKVNQESAFIRSIKNSILLWENWVFNVLKDYLSIKYDNVVITEWKTSKDYSIKVKDSNLKYSHLWKEYYWIFNSEYIYQNWRTSSFKNPSIVFIDYYGNPLFNGNKITITWIYKLEDFYKQIERLINNLESIEIIINQIYKYTYETNVSINYNSISNKLFFKTDKLYIVKKWILLEEIEYNWKNILTKRDKISNLYKYLNNLK